MAILHRFYVSLDSSLPFPEVFIPESSFAFTKRVLHWVLALIALLAVLVHVPDVGNSCDRMDRMTYHAGGLRNLMHVKYTLGERAYDYCDEKILPGMRFIQRYLAHWAAYIKLYLQKEIAEARIRRRRVFKKLDLRQPTLRRPAIGSSSIPHNLQTFEDLTLSPNSRTSFHHLLLLISQHAIFDSLIRNLHLHEVISLLSITPYTYTFLRGPSAYPFSFFAEHSCIPQTRRNCWGCGTQICKEFQRGVASCTEKGCHRTLHALTSPMEHHLNSCRPVCSACYIATVCQGANRGPQSRYWLHARRPSFATGRCACLDNTNFMKNAGSDLFQTHRRAVCINCHGDPRKAEEKHDIPVKKELLRVEEGLFKGKCSSCEHVFKNGFGRGVRWWICTACGGECKSDIHKKSNGLIERRRANGGAGALEIVEEEREKKESRADDTG